ncbi:MAG TPA: Gfo/Idh/MocA family oxidoreductase, partial [Abditibacteriaceae bacterium]|nr:Gfo/Idh/MocA family oxidoreductase [Abditibacteriaceae bacterium]
MTNSPLRVAVIGVSGIGKNHARWFHLHGCEVCAFAGSSPERIELAHRVLQDSFGFSGRGYDDVEAMLREAQPAAVCVASPPPLHYEHTLQALAAGAHVLCEKPLVYDPAQSPAALVGQARQLVHAAEARGLVFGTQMQYAVGVDRLVQLAGVKAPEVRAFEMVMETKSLKHGRDYDP